jgi:hypothetical protein
MHRTLSDTAKPVAPYHRDLKRLGLAVFFYTVAILAAILASAVAHADIEIKPQYEAHEPIVATVTITEVPEGAKLRGSIQIDGASYIPAGDNVYHVWAAPGKYTIRAQGVWVLTKDVTVGDQTFPVLLDFGQYSYVKSFVVGEGKPDPPNPPDPPTPGGPYQVVIFYSPDQLDNLTPDQRQILNSQAFREKLKAAGHSLLGVLPDNAAPSPQSKFRAFYNAVAGDPMPRVAVASKDGGKVADFPLPATVSELEALLKTEVLK